MIIYIQQKHFIIILKYSNVFVCFRGYWIMLVSVAAQILGKCPHSAKISPRGLRINYSAVKDIIVVLIARRYSRAEIVSWLCPFHDKRWRNKMETLTSRYRPLLCRALRWYPWNWLYFSTKRFRSNEKSGLNSSMFYIYIYILRCISKINPSMNHIAYRDLLFIV